MRTIARYGITFFLGLVFGGVAAATFVGWHWNRNFRNWYVRGVAGEAFTAREIYAGRADKLADQIREQLPDFVLAVRRNGGGEGRDGAYWLVSDVYQISGAEVPSDIKPVIDKLPPRASCKPPKPQMRRNGAAP